MKLDNVEVRVISPRGERYTWSHDLPEQYMTITLVRIRTDEGAEGIGGVGNYTSYCSDRNTPSPYSTSTGYGSIAAGGCEESPAPQGVSDHTRGLGCD